MNERWRVAGPAKCGTEITMLGWPIKLPGNRNVKKNKLNGDYWLLFKRLLVLLEEMRDAVKERIDGDIAIGDGRLLIEIFYFPLKPPFCIYIDQCTCPSRRRTAALAASIDRRRGIRGRGKSRPPGPSPPSYGRRLMRTVPYDRVRRDDSKRARCSTFEKKSKIPGMGKALLAPLPPPATPLFIEFRVAS